MDIYTGAGELKKLVLICESSQELCMELDDFEKINWLKNNTADDSLRMKYLNVKKDINKKLLESNKWFFII